jgi:hypothetical protein
MSRCSWDNSSGFVAARLWSPAPTFQVRGRAGPRGCMDSVATSADDRECTRALLKHSSPRRSLNTRRIGANRA